MPGQERDLVDAVQALQGDEGRWGLTPQVDPIAQSARQLSVGPGRPFAPAARFPSPLIIAETWPEPAQDAIKADDEWALVGVAGAPQAGDPFADPRAPRMLQKFTLSVSSDDITDDYLATKLVGDDGAGDNLKVTLSEQNPGAAETLKIVVTKADTLSSVTHNVLSATHTDSLNEAVVDGDIIVGDDSPAKWQRLVAGNAADVLTMTGGNPTWEPPVTQTNPLLDGSSHSDTDGQTVTRGSLIYGNATPEWGELVIGDAGQVLTSDGTDVAWAAAGAAGAEPGFDSTMTHKVQFQANAGTQEHIINAADLRTKFLKAIGSARDSALGVEDAAWEHDESPTGFQIGATPAADVVILSFLGAALDLIVDKDDGKLKWSYTDRAPVTHGWCSVSVRSATADTSL